MARRSESVRKLDELHGEYVSSFWKLCDDGKEHKVFMSADDKSVLQKHSFRKDFVLFTREEYKNLYHKNKTTKPKTTTKSKKPVVKGERKQITGSGYKISQYFGVKSIKQALGDYDKELNRNYDYNINDVMSVFAYCKRNDIEIKKEIEVTQLLQKNYKRKGGR